MAPLIQTLSLALLTGMLGIAVGWHLGSKGRKRQIYKLQQELGDRSLECLETRRHLRTLSGHLKENLKKDVVIQRLRKRQKASEKKLRQFSIQWRQKEKNHFIDTARLKLELHEALALSDIQPLKSPPADDSPGHLRGIPPSLESTLTRADVKRIKQVDDPSGDDRQSLARAVDRSPAE